MRGATVGLIAAVLALAGCKSTEKGDDKPFGGFAGRSKTTPVKDKDKDKDGKTGGLSWLEDGKTPGAGASVPKGGAAGNPADPNFNAKAAAQDALGGRVLDPLGRPARNVAIHMEPVGGATADLHPADIDTNNEGYFFVRGLKAGHAYDVTAQAVQGGKPLTGSVQTKVPNPILLITLSADLPAPSGGPPKGASDTFPPAPRPTDGVGSGFPPKPPAPAPNDGAWSPGGTISGVPPATIGGSAAPKPPAAVGPYPQPDDLTPSVAPSKPENVAEGQRPFKPPALNVPGGPPSVPPLPALPPSFNKSGGGKSSMNNGFTTGSNAGKVALLDSLERPWELSAAPADSLVLVNFVESACEGSREALPVLRDVQGRYGARGLQVVAVLCDNVPQRERAARASKYGSDHALNFGMYVEPGAAAGSVRDRFDVEVYPTAFLLTPGGKVLWTGHPGDRIKLEAAIKQNLSK